MNTALLSAASTGWLSSQETNITSTNKRLDKGFARSREEKGAKYHRLNEYIMSSAITYRDEGNPLAGLGS